MSLRLPKISSIQPQGIWSGRNVRAVFLERHNRVENLEPVRIQTDKTSRLVDPTSQLFLIEGNQTYDTLENQYVRKYLEQSGIRVEDPIVNPFTKAIANQAGVNRLQAATSVLVFDYLSSYLQYGKQLPGENKLEELLRRSIEAVARKFNVSQKSVRDEFSSLSLQDGDYIQEKLKILLGLRQRLVDVSNVQSREELITVLDANKQSNVFIMTGGEHEDVFQPTFSSLNRKNVLSFPNEGALIRTGSSNFLPSEQVLPIRQAIQSSGITTLAAMWDDPVGQYERGRLTGEVINTEKVRDLIDKQDVELTRKGYSTWQKFEDFEARLAGDIAKWVGHYRTEKMISYLTGENLKPLVNSKLYSKSNLVLLLSRSYNQGQSNAARILTLVLEKIGDTLPDEVEILKLLGSDERFNLDFAEAIFKTSKHKWRNNPELIVEFMVLSRKKGSSDYLRTRQECIRIVDLAAVSADPSLTFIKDTSGDSAIYRGKDPYLESILLCCSIESSKNVRAKALQAIGMYLEENVFDNYHRVIDIDTVRGLNIITPLGYGETRIVPKLDACLISGVKDNIENVFYAIGQRIKSGTDKTNEFLQYILKGLDDLNATTRGQAFNALAKYVRKDGLINDQFINVVRNHLNEKDEEIRSNVVYILSRYIQENGFLELSNAEINCLIDIVCNSSNKASRSNATYILAVIANGNLDLIPEEKLDQVEHLFTVNRDPEVATGKELQTINEALNKLVTVSGLEEVKLLLELEGHPSRGKVEQLIRKKDRYRDAIGPLLNRINALYQANLKLQTQVEILEDRNAELENQNAQLRDRVVELTEEMDRIQASIKSKRLKNTLLSIGGTALRNIVKGRGIAHGEFVKSIFIDVGWDQIVNNLN